jgi:uncharacterized membrane protein
MKKTLGWAAVVITIAFSSLWAFWGIIENFHEGWYADNIWENLYLMFLQYLLFALFFIGIGLAAIRWQKPVAVVMVVISIIVPAFYVQSNAAIVIFGVPLFGAAILYWFGEIPNKKLAYILTAAVPLLVMIGFGIEPAIRVAGRFDSGHYSAVQIKGNGVELMWAPKGPGWITETEKINFHSVGEADSICRHLSENGTEVMDTAVNIWRLPTIDEAVRSQMRHKKNAGGTWDAIKAEPHYKVQPDKESPLWKCNYPIIYWWTSTEVDSAHVFRIVYNGSVQKIPKRYTMGSLGFRAVRKPGHPKFLNLDR